MEKRNKISLLIGLFGIGILFLIVLYFSVPAFINSEVVKKKVNAYFSQKTGGSMSFQESGIHLFPLPHVDLRQVHISVPKKADGLIQSLGVYPAVWPLLKGDVQFSKLSFDSPRFTVALFEDMGKTSLEEIEDKIRAFVYDLTSIVPNSFVTIEKGKLDLTKGNRVAFSFDLIQTRITTAGKSLNISLTCASNLWDMLSFNSSLNAEDLKSRGNVEVKHLHPHAVFTQLSPKMERHIGDVDADVSVNFQALGLKQIQADAESSLPYLIISREGKNLTMKDLAIRGNINIAPEKVSVLLSELNISDPDLHISAEYALDRASGTGKLNVEGKSIDVNSTRKPFLWIGGDIPVIRSIFNIVQGGTIPVLHFSSVGKFFIDLGKIENMRIAGQIQEGDITIPANDLRFSNVAGDVVIAKGILEGKNIDVSLENHRGSHGQLQIGLQEKNAPFHLDIWVKVDLGQLPSLLKQKNLVSSKAVLREMDRLSGTHGSALGRLILGDRLDAIDVIFDVSEMNLATRYEPLPFPLVLTEAKVFFDEKILKITGVHGSIGNSIFSRLAGKINLDDTAFIEITAGQLTVNTDEMYPWISSFIKLPPEIVVRSPLFLSDTNLSWEKNGKTTLNSKIIFGKRTEVTFSLTKFPDALSVRDISIRDDRSAVTAELLLDTKTIDISFNGNLTADTLSTIFAQQIFSDSTLKGDFRTHIVLTDLMQSKIDGVIKGENFPVPWTYDIPLAVRNFNLRAEKNRIFVNNAEMLLGEDKLVLKGVIDAVPKSISVNIDLSADGFDWENLENIFRKTENTQHEKEAGLFGGLPIKGTVRIQSGFFTFHQYTLKPFHADISFDDENIHIRAKKATLCGISTAGDVDITSRKAAVDIGLSASNLALQPTVLCLSDKKVDLTGTFEIQADLKAEGDIATIGKSLHGTFNITAKDGKIFKSQTIDKTLDLVNETENFKGKLPDLDRGSIDYRLLTMRGSMDGQRIFLKEGMIDAPAFEIVAEGEIHLSEKTLDLNALVAPLNIGIVRKIPVLGNIMGGGLLAVPVKIKGNMFDPSVTFLSPSAIGSAFLGIVERTIKLPITIIEPVPPERKSE